MQESSPALQLICFCLSIALALQEGIPAEAAKVFTLSLPLFLRCAR